MSTYSLEQIGTTRTWDYTLPTLQKQGRFTNRTPISNGTFVTKFYTDFPQFVEFDWTNVCLRGGAIVNMLLNQLVVDLDFFFYGFENDQDLMQKVDQFLKYLLNVERAHVEKYNTAQHTNGRSRGSPINVNINAVRNGSVITVTASSINRPIQIVIGSFKNKDQMLTKTDIAVSGIIFDGQQVIISEKAKWELENMTIRLDNNVYPRVDRLDKYFDKGFDIILPQLDITKLPTRCLKHNLVEYIETPSMGFTYSSINNNKIELNKFIINSQKGNSLHGYSSCSSTLLDGRSVLYKNIRTIASLYHNYINKKLSENDITKFIVFAESDFITNVLQPLPDINERQIINTYGGISKELFADSVLDFNTFEKYYSTMSLQQFLTIISCDESLNPLTHIAHSVDNLTKTQMEASINVMNGIKQIPNIKCPIIKDFNANHIHDSFLFYGDYMI